MVRGAASMPVVILQASSGHYTSPFVSLCAHGRAGHPLHMKRYKISQ